MPAVTVEDRGAISIIRINRPERLNAIGQAVAVEMQQAFKQFDADPDKRVAILSATAAIFVQNEQAGGSARQQRNAAYLQHVLAEGSHPRLAGLLAQQPGTPQPGPPPPDPYRGILARILTGLLAVPGAA